MALTKASYSLISGANTAGSGASFVITITFAASNSAGTWNAWFEYF